MEERPVRRQIGEGVYFTAVREPKFKSDRMTAVLIAPLERTKATVRALVPFLLRKGCGAYPDFTALNAKLASMYGAILDADVTKYADLQMVQLSVQTADDTFSIAGEPLGKESAELLCSVLTDPVLDKYGHFPEQDFRVERNYLIDTIESELNEKRTYAIGKCTEILFREEPFGVKRYGYKEDAEKLTAAEVTDAWRELLRRARIEILFTGPGDPNAAERVFTERLGRLERDLFGERITPPKPYSEYTELDEKMDVVQGKLVMAYRIGAPEKDAERAAARMMTALYGGTPFSKLFMNVREKMSLCYYCAARYDKPTGVILVDSGVETANMKKAEAEIGNQLAAVAKGDFTEEELKNTLLLAVNSLKSVEDSLDGAEGWYLTRILEGDMRTPEEDAETLGAVTAAQIAGMAGRAKLAAVYRLTGEGKTDE